MAKVLVSEPLPAPVVKLCRSMLSDEVVLEVVPDFELQTFAKMAVDADILLVGHRRVDTELLSYAPSLQLVQRAGLGHENIIVSDTNTAGIPAAYTPGANADSVAEHAIMHMLIALRRFADGERATRINQWPMGKMAEEGIGDIVGSTIGLIGMGHIGIAVVERLLPFKPKQILYYKRNRLDSVDEKRLSLTYVSLGELLSRSQIVSLHTPLTDETYHMISDNEFATMPKGSFIINVSRGGLIDEDALRRAIETGQISGAGLDNIEQEEDGGNPFVDLPQVLVTPHMAGPSKQGLYEILSRACANINLVLDGHSPIDLIPGSQAGLD
jgi:phosphoglycerate dehydrogenase-like enzyme